MNNVKKLRASVLGYGAIGKRVVQALSEGKVAGAELVGVVSRTSGKASADGYRELTREQAVQESDLIVECAGGGAVREHGPAIIAGGGDLLVSSIGALIDEELRKTMLEDGPGRCFLTSGGIGGLDLLSAATRDGGLETAMLTSTKKASALVQPWMSEAEATDLRTTTTPITIFEGSVSEAIRLFPASLNVGVALAAATGLWDETKIKLVGDPDANLTTHEIEAKGSSGQYQFTITNYPLVSNPTSSAVVSAALLRGIAAMATPSGSFI